MYVGTGRALLMTKCLMSMNNNPGSLVLPRYLMFSPDSSYIGTPYMYV